MTPEAQLLITGAVEAGIAVTLGVCAYRIWRRRTATAPPRMHDSTSEGSRHKHVELLNELARLIGEHTHSVELFQRWVESAGTDPRQPHADDLDVSSQVRRMRAANKEFDRCAESRSTEICDAADRDPQLFRDISVRFSDHREKTTTFDSALSRVPVGGTPSDLQLLSVVPRLGVPELFPCPALDLADARKLL